MKSTYNIAIWAALVSIVIKLVVFEFFPNDSALENLPRFGYLLSIPVVLFLALNAVGKSSPNLAFMDHLKEGMKVGGLFVALVSGFTFVYYKWIDPNFWLNKLSQRLDEAFDQGYSPEQLAELQKELTSTLMSAGMWTSISLLVFMIYAFICGAVLTAFIRKAGTV